MRAEPTFAGAVQRGVVGDDPLGLAPTNERLYNSALPGFNNYVRYIRVYSALCWTVKQVENALRHGQARTEQSARQLLEEALQKVELALVWFNRGAPQLAGMRRQFPETDKSVEMKFATFGTSDVTLFEAVTYRPSLTTGLGFLESRSAGTYGCLPAGDRLAAAYDNLVQQTSGGKWLRSLAETRARRSKIDGLGEALRLDQPTTDEQQAFLERFFPREISGDASNDDRARFLTLRLMFRAVAAESAARRRAGDSDRLSVAQVRACMARGEATDGTSIVLPEYARVQAWWAVLQVRQLQRIAQEALYCVVERWIAGAERAGRSRSISDCVEEISQAGAKILASWELDSVASITQYLEESRGDCSTFFQAAARHPGSDEEEENEADVFGRIESLADTSALEFDESGCPAVAYACFALVFCALEARLIQTNAEAARTMKADGDSCSLLRLAATVEAHHASSVADLVGFFVKDWVILRHFQVVAARSLRMDGKNRFRFVVGDDGLERFDRGAPLPKPAISEDKLAHAIYLCTQAGLLSESDGGYKLTAQGRKHAGLN